MPLEQLHDLTAAAETQTYTDAASGILSPQLHNNNNNNTGIVCIIRNGFTEFVTYYLYSLVHSV